MSPLCQAGRAGACLCVLRGVGGGGAAWGPDGGQGELEVENS